ncbi:MAG: biotin--[acetyl-CoA-carboxylase] ligase [Endomicrobium sp.]|jgi:BirA family biotin operon repressor/biotin-[acetyl-CoA-carboxylase] ligase|nr:biotin--[acetyl-CoA-carboxylase] ligase [Endomicrobium sp.]
MSIIEILSPKKYISGNEIGRFLGISRAAVHKQINRLRQIGYTIKSSSKGYIIVKKCNLFNEYEIEANLKKPLNICKMIKYYKETVSTQTAVKKLAEKDFDEGVVVIAEKQTKGYGRIKRVWNSNAGGLWFSMLLKPVIHPDESSKLSLLFSIVLNRILEKKYGICSEIKWPNDILICGKKVAGIIIEMSAEQDIINWVAAGIGVNINNSLPEDLRNISISIKEVLKREIGRAEFIAAFLTEFESLYFNFQKDGFKQFLEEYNSKAAYKNALVTVNSGYNDAITGKNFGIDESGKLIIEIKNKFEKIISGTLRRAKK